MANFSFNVSLGREVEFYSRVDNNDPANSAFIGLVLAESGLEADSTLKDYDTVAAILAATNNEVTNVNYARVSWTDGDLAAYTVDDTNNRILLQLPSKTFTAIAAGDYWRKFIIAMDFDTTAGTDADLIPVKAFDLLNANNTAIIPDGGNILCAWPNGFHISS